MRSCGIDPATCTGMALVGEGEDRGKTIHLSEERGYSRLHLIAEEVNRILTVWTPAVVAVEHYAWVRNISSFITLVGVGTVIRSVLYQRQIPWVEVPPTVLKKWTTGKGNATKDQMAAAVKDRWAYHSASHDIVDAFALAQMAQLGWADLLAIQGVAVGWASFSTLVDSPRSGKESG